MGAGSDAELASQAERARELERQGRELRERLERSYVTGARLRHARDLLEGSAPARLGAALRAAFGRSPKGSGLRDRASRVLREMRLERERARVDMKGDPRDGDLSRELSRALARSKAGSERRVLHFSKEFSKASETFTYALISGLDARPDLDNFVMFFTRELAEERPYAKTVQLHGYGRVALEAGSPEFREATRQVLDTLRPLLVHCHFGWMGVPFVRVLRALGSALPVVITLHGTDVNMWPHKYPWYAAQLRELAEDPAVHFTTHSETYRTRLSALGLRDERIVVMPNSFAPRFAASARPSFSPGAHLSVLSVARMDVWKGHEYLIAGFASFVERYPRASLTLVGYGPCEEALRAQVEALGLSGCVRFYGRAAHFEVPALLRSHDVYVQPSIRHPRTRQEEGQPIAVLEAIAGGLPVIVTDTGAMPETVRIADHEGSAWLVPPGSSEALAEALYDVATTQVDALRRLRYRQAICEKHSEAAQVARTVALYERVLASAGR